MRGVIVNKMNIRGVNKMVKFSKAVELRLKKNPIVKMVTREGKLSLNLTTLKVEVIDGYEKYPKINGMSLAKMAKISGYMIGLDVDGNSTTGQYQLIASLKRMAKNIPLKGLAADELTTGVAHEKGSQENYIKPDADKIGYVKEGTRYARWQMAKFLKDKAKAKTEVKVKAKGKAKPITKAKTVINNKPKVKAKAKTEVKA